MFILDTYYVVCTSLPPHLNDAIFFSSVLSYCLHLFSNEVGYYFSFLSISQNIQVNKVAKFPEQNLKEVSSSFKAKQIIEKRFANGDFLPFHGLHACHYKLWLVYFYPIFHYGL